MKSFMTVAGLATMLLLPVTANAQQGRQQTEDQTNLQNNVKALPPTHKRAEIIRSERSTRTNRGHTSTTGAAPR